ncbi:MAG: AEC family transporter [Thermoanaerobaculia bacterium]|jgi:predicted permease|nr:AEC family transporter [Thermoanaerobaculia bacterium]MBP9826738.1 AEC family transporter [Thermoanaerobaculia bacterium]
MALDAFLLVIGMLALGKACAATGRFPPEAAAVLNRFVLDICLPAAVLRYASRLELDLSLLRVIAVPWLLCALSAGLVFLYARHAGLAQDRMAVLLLCVPLGNTSFLGYPLTRAMLGETALPHAVVYDQFGSFLLLSTWGLWVLARYGGDRRPTAREIGRKIVRFPPFVALAVALTVMPAAPPALVEGLLVRLSDALLPVVTFAVGLDLRLRLPRGALAPLTVGLVLKLVLLPLAAWGLVRLLGLDGIAATATVFESAMPPMITAGALASSHRLAPELAAAMVGYGVLLSLATLPLWALLLS